MEMGAINPDGIMTVDFNQEMIAPDSIDQSIYQKIFEFNIKNADGEIVTAKFQNSGERRLTEDEDNLSLEVTKHDGLQIAI